MIRHAGRVMAGAAVLIGLGLATGRASEPPPVAPAIVVYKSPTCGCCSKWVQHLQRAGFRVTVHDVDTVAAIKRRYDVPRPLEACHTAVTAGYVVEGHVPADVIARLLRERPDVAGIAVPGMPAGSPGMEGPIRQRYDVLAFRREGGWRVYEQR